MTKDDRIYVEDMLESAALIKKYLRGVERQSFLDDTLLQDAVIRRLEIIGEASAQISVEWREKYPQIEWREMIGLRNRAIHGYAGINNEIIWDITQQDLDPLQVNLTKLLADLEHQAGAQD